MSSGAYLYSLSKRSGDELRPSRQKTRDGLLLPSCSLMVVGKLSCLEVVVVVVAVVGVGTVDFQVRILFLFKGKQASK